MVSIKPAPKVGVGMRKIRLLVLEKSGWLIEHPGGLSDRPAMVKMSCTPPSEMKRTSRTGPSNLMKAGTVLPGAIAGACTTCGLFIRGLDPPTSGNAWQPAQESRLNLGPSPSA